MKKLSILFCLLLAFEASGINVTNYPIRTVAQPTDWFWLSSVPEKTNYNMPWTDLLNQIASSIAPGTATNVPVLVGGTNITISVSGLTNTIRGRTEWTFQSITNSPWITSVGATNAANTIVNVAISGIVQTLITPSQFGAACDGSTDDWVAISNMFNYVNAKGGRCMIDFNGKTNLYSRSPTAINVPNVTIQNGTILYNSTNGYAIGHNAATGDAELSGFTVQNMHIKRLGFTTVPNTNCVGINLNADNAGFVTYYGNTLITGNQIENFWNLIECGPNAGISITLNKLTSVWNGAIWFVEGVFPPDFINISLNDMDQGNSTFPPGPQQYLNCTCIYLGSGTHGANIFGNNMGNFHWVIRTGIGPSGDSCRLRIEYNNCGGNFSTTTNWTPFELWNVLKLYWNGNQPGGFGSSNCIAQVGLYWTNMPPQPQGCYFSPAYNNVSIDMCGTNYFEIPPTVISQDPWTCHWHTNMYDAGYVANFVHGNVPNGSDDFILGQPTRSNIPSIISAYVGANGATQKILSSTPSSGNVELNGANVFFDIGGVIKWGVDPSGHLVPKGAGLNLGGESGYPIGTVTATALTINSNSWAIVPALTAGQNFYCASNGVPHVIWVDQSSGSHTNRLAP